MNSNRSTAAAEELKAQEMAAEAKRKKKFEKYKSKIIKNEYKSQDPFHVLFKEERKTKKESSVDAVRRVSNIPGGFRKSVRFSSVRRDTRASKFAE